MLTRLLRTYLRPYTGQVVVVVALLVTQTIGNLYLPNLNADIINNGVVKGNLHYILMTGAVMLAITLALGVVSDRGGLLGLARRDGSRCRHAGRRSSPACRRSRPTR